MKKIITTIISLLIITILVSAAAYVIRYGMAERSDLFSASKEGESDAKRAVEDFYTWYLGRETSPLASGSYKNSQYLSIGWIANVEELVVSFDKGGFDPFVCAQDIPGAFTVGSVDERGDNAQATVDMVYGATVRSVPVKLAYEAEEWRIVSVECGDVQNDVSEKVTQTIVYFHNPARVPDGEDDCRAVYGVERTLASSATPTARAHWALTELFRGPTEEEAGRGFTSFFSEATDGLLKEVRVEGAVAYVNMADIRTVVPNASTSCGSVSLMTEMEETLKHSREITKVIFAIDGDTQAFYDWVQIGCAPENNNCDNTPFR